MILSVDYYIFKATRTTSAKFITACYKNDLQNSNRSIKRLNGRTSRKCLCEIISITTPLLKVKIQRIDLIFSIKTQ